MVFSLPVIKPFRRHQIVERTRDRTSLMELDSNTFVGAQRTCEMAEEPAEPTNVEDFTIRRLMKEGNVTETQARQLIAALGYDWSSLLREARFLAKKR